MSTDIQRLLVTQALLATLRGVQVDGANLQVGDTVIPTDAGWKGQPGAEGSKFVAYAVLGTLTASRSEGGIGESQADWWLPYSVQCFGVLPDQAQWLADRARAAIAALKDQIIQMGPDVSNYKIAYITTTQLGGVNKIVVANSAFYGIQDGVSLSLRKRRS